MYGESPDLRTAVDCLKSPISAGDWTRRRAGERTRLRRRGNALRSGDQAPVQPQRLRIEQLRQGVFHHLPKLRASGIESKEACDRLNQLVPFRAEILLDYFADRCLNFLGRQRVAADSTLRIAWTLTSTGHQFRTRKNPQKRSERGRIPRKAQEIRWLHPTMISLSNG